MTDEPGALKIVTYPAASLRERAAAISEIDDELRELAEKMMHTMHQRQGVGLAGPQVGINRKVVVINPTGEREDRKILINPEVLERRGDMEGIEGCLSVPGVSGNVHRSSYVKVIAYDLDGNELEITATDFVARVLQHEIDHLEGMLLIDRMTPEARIEAREALKMLEEHGGVLPGSQEAAH